MNWRVKYYWLGWFKPVAEPVLIRYEWGLPFIFQLVTNSRNTHAYSTSFNRCFRLPNRVDQIIYGEDLVRVFHEKFEQNIFDFGQLYFGTLFEYPAMSRVELNMPAL